MISVITSTLNAAQFLERALKSAERQSTPLEHIVIDAGSTDGTIELCRRYPDVALRVIRGASIYQAWNAGIAAAHGDIIVFLNADDELAVNAAATIETIFRKNPSAEIVAGRACLLDDEKPKAEPVLLIAVPSGELDLAQLTTGAPAINAMAFKRSLFARRGAFESSFGVAGDRAFLLRLALAKEPPKVAQTEATLYRYHAHATSLTLKRGLEQRVRIARAHIALAQSLLGQPLPTTAACWVRHLYLRERVVASLRCLVAGHFAVAWELIRGCPGSERLLACSILDGRFSPVGTNKRTEND